MKYLKLKTVQAILLIVFLVYIVNLLQRCGADPNSYLEEVKLEFKGKVVKKYFEKSTNCVVKVDKSTRIISGLSKELVDNIEVGDSLIKYKNSNCCLLVKNTVHLNLEYIFIPESVLEKSEYLRNIYEIFTSVDAIK